MTHRVGLARFYFWGRDGEGGRAGGEGRGRSVPFRGHTVSFGAVRSLMMRMEVLCHVVFFSRDVLSPDFVSCALLHCACHIPSVIHILP